MDEKEKAPKRREQECVSSLSLLELQNKSITDSKGNLIGFQQDDLDTIAAVLNIIGEHGYSVKGAWHILRLCKIALKECTLVATDYSS